MTGSPLPESESALARWLPPAAIVVLAAPCLFLAYLPMTDLPQHTAVTSILKNLGDPAFAFDAYYEATAQPPDTTRSISSAGTSRGRSPRRMRTTTSTPTFRLGVEA
jgi:hypothetical protein